MPYLIGLMGTAQFLKIITALGLVVLGAYIVRNWVTGDFTIVSKTKSELLERVKHHLGYWRTQASKIREISKTSTEILTQYLKSPHAIKRTSIGSVICIVVGLVTFVIYNWHISKCGFS